MPLDKRKTNKKHVHIEAYSAYRNSEGVVIKSIGQVELIYDGKKVEEIRGKTHMKGDDLEVTAYGKNSDQTFKYVLGDTCLLLLPKELNHKAVLVESHQKLAMAACDLLYKLYSPD